MQKQRTHESKPVLCATICIKKKSVVGFATFMHTLYSKFWCSTHPAHIVNTFQGLSCLTLEYPQILSIAAWVSDLKKLYFFYVELIGLRIENVHVSQFEYQGSVLWSFIVIHVLFVSITICYVFGNITICFDFLCVIYLRSLLLVSKNTELSQYHNEIWVIKPCRFVLSCWICSAQFFPSELAAQPHQVCVDTCNSKSANEHEHQARQAPENEICAP